MLASDVINVDVIMPLAHGCSCGCHHCCVHSKAVVTTIDVGQTLLDSGQKDGGVIIINHILIKAYYVQSTTDGASRKM